VNCPVDDLRGELVVEQVERGEGERVEERGEGERVEVRPRWGVAQVRRHPVAERWHPGAGVFWAVTPTVAVRGRCGTFTPRSIALYTAALGQIAAYPLSYLLEKSTRPGGVCARSFRHIAGSDSGRVGVRGVMSPPPAAFPNGISRWEPWWEPQNGAFCRLFSTRFPHSHSSHRFHVQMPLIRYRVRS
jgi:hypothetical protein